MAIKEYIAPDNGWVTFSAMADGDINYVKVNGSDIAVDRDGGSYDEGHFGTMFPVTKNDVISFRFSSVTTQPYCQIIFYPNKK